MCVQDGHAKVLRSVQPQVYRGRQSSAAQLACSALLAGGERRDRNAIVSIIGQQPPLSLLKWATEINTSFHWAKDGDRGQDSRASAVQCHAEREFMRGVRDLRVDAILSPSIITALQDASAPAGQNCCATADRVP
jgi:hypothetical protein